MVNIVDAGPALLVTNQPVFGECGSPESGKSSEDPGSPRPTRRSSGESLQIGL